MQCREGTFLFLFFISGGIKRQLGCRVCQSSVRLHNCMFQTGFLKILFYYVLVIQSATNLWSAHWQNSPGHHCFWSYRCSCSLVLYSLVYLSWNTADFQKGKVIWFLLTGDFFLLPGETEVFRAQEGLKTSVESILSSVHLLFDTIKRWKESIIQVGIVESHLWQGGDQPGDKC